MAKVPVTVRVEESELAYLKEFCEQSGRSQTDVLREYIRTLPAKLKRLKSSAIDPLTFPSVGFEEKYLLPCIEGIYFVTTPEQDIIYIGRSNDIKRRWQNHHQKAVCQGCKIHWMEVKGKTQEKLEREYIERFRPKFNRYPQCEPNPYN